MDSEPNDIALSQSLVKTIEARAGWMRRPRGVKWSRAALALAMGQSTADAATKANVKPQAVSRWKRDERFQAMLAAYSKRIAEESLKTGIANQSYRLAAANRRHERLTRVIEARAADAQNETSPLFTTPGADQGVMVAEQFEVIGEGDNARTVATKIKFDAALVKELRELEVFADKETGEKKTRGPGGRHIGNLNVLINFPSLTTDEVSKAVAAAPIIDLPNAGRRMLK